MDCYLLGPNQGLKMEFPPETIIKTMKEQALKFVVLQNWKQQKKRNWK